MSTPSYVPIGTYYSTNPGFPSSVSHVHFDQRQELIWVGHASGHFRSFGLPYCEPYIAHQGFYSSIHSILTDLRFNSGLLCLATEGVKLVDRRGLVHWTLSYDFLF
jgi:hypothetical protein